MIEQPSGVLLVDKPKGWTSFDVVAKVRGLVRTELRKTNPQLKNYKVGHTGTLDPSATGLLVLCLGKATKLVPSMIKHDKTYAVEMTLGATSSTGDQEGVITEAPLSEIPSHEAIRSTLRAFVGEQLQTPPAYSAIRVDGKRAYELARQGKEVKLEPRSCTIYDLELNFYEYPTVCFTTSVSSGTYIRSLVEDIGKKLGTSAYMSNLRRTRVDVYDLVDAITVDDLSFETISDHLLLVCQTKGA